MALKVQSRDLYAILNGEVPAWEGQEPNADGTYPSLDRNLTHAAYNALDSAVTLRVHNALAPKLAASPHATVSYHFVRAMQGPAMDLMRRGVAIQQKVRQDETQRYTTLREKAQTTLDRLADAVWGPETYTIIERESETYIPLGKRGQPLTPRTRTIRTERPAVRPRGLNPNSSTQVLAFFNIALGLPVEYEIRKTPFGRERTPSANDKALRKWAGMRRKGPEVEARNREVYPVKIAQPFVNLILTIRDADKMLAILRTPLDPDGRMRCSYNVVGTENGRWSSSKNAFGRGCVLAGTEVLTPHGWRPIEQIGYMDAVAQWSNGNVEFVGAVPFTTQYRGLLHKVEGEQIHQELTAEHRVLSRSHRGVWTVEAAQKTASRSQTYIPIAGEFCEGTESTPSWYAMLMADGSFEGSGWRLGFKRPRKIERFLKLAAEFGFSYTEQKAKEGYRRFYISGHKYAPKYWDSWVLNESQESLSALVEEARHWDGHDRGSGFIFFTAHKDCAEWFATAAHLCGRGATVRREEQNEGSYSTTTMWWVNVKSRDYAQVMRKHWSIRVYIGPVYCVTVPSGFFLIRSNGKISVTGNTNIQNITPSMRRMFCADDGYRMVSTDLEQAESRLVAGLVWASTGDRTYLTACESGDLHTTVCMMAWPELGWSSNDFQANRQLADTPCADIPSYSYRDVAKRLGHGSNYRGSPFGIAQAVGIPAGVVEDFQRRYFRAYPAIGIWHGHIRDGLRSDLYLDTPLLRRRHFFSRPNEDSTLREAIAFIPQSTVGEILNLIMYRCWRRSILPPSHPSHLPIQLLLQNHDAFVFQTPEAQHLPTIIREVNTEFTRASIPLVRGDQHEALVIPGEFVTGWNWAYADKPNAAPDQRTFPDGNIDGLTKWRRADTRIRQQRAATSPADWLGRRG